MKEEFESTTAPPSESIHGQEIELDQEYIVLAIPNTTVEVKIEATIFYNGELHKVERVMGFEEVRDAIKEAQDGYIPSDALFSLTPLGEEMLKELKERYRGDDPDAY